MIVRAHAMGNQWQSVALLLPGRTGNDVKNRWKSKRMHLVSHGQMARRSGELSTPADSGAPTCLKATDDSFETGGGGISDGVVGQIEVRRQGEAVLHTTKETIFRKRHTTWTPSEDELLKSIVASVKRTGDVAGRVVVKWLVVSGLVSFVRMRTALDCSLMCSTGRWCPR